MPRVGFEPTTTKFERVKTVHTLDLASTVIRGKIYIFFLILNCEAIGNAATPGLLYQPRVIMKMIMEKQMECRLAEETEVLGENMSHRHFCPSQNPT
jgi:hypothetical protein